MAELLEQLMALPKEQQRLIAEALLANLSESEKEDKELIALVDERLSRYLQNPHAITTLAEIKHKFISRNK